jgi:hypothetical protein
MRPLTILVVLFSQLILAAAALAQQDDPNVQTAFCNFADDQQVSLQYNASAATPKNEPHNGKVWLPGGVPMTLFAQTTLTLNNTLIPVGAYSVYVIPGKKDWTLIVNKNVTPGSAYDESKDLARSSMELGEVDSPPRQLQASFAHTSAKTCAIRLYYEKTGAFADFQEK